MRHLLRLRHAPLLLGCVLFAAPAADGWERVRGLDEHGRTRLMRVAGAGDAAATRALLEQMLSDVEGTCPRCADLLREHAARLDSTETGH